MNGITVEIPSRTLLSDEERIQRRRESNRRSFERHPHLRRRAALKRYGLTIEQFEAILESQKGVCASCGHPETRKTKQGKVAPLHVDHDHETGVVRGLLCARCNLALGYLKDDASRVAGLLAYVKSWSR